MARPVGEINASSMADIAFLLLIFFLVTTTMNVDTGLARMLPPMPDPTQKVDDQDVKQRNIFTVLVSKSDRLLVEDEMLDVSQLREKTKEFILNPTDAPNLPEKKVEDIPFFGPMPVSKGVISLRNDRGTSYKMYLYVQNELAAALNELRNDAARAKFGKLFDDCNEEQQDAVKKLYPQRISEAEPKNVGGK